MARDNALMRDSFGANSTRKVFSTSKTKAASMAGTANRRRRSSSTISTTARMTPATRSPWVPADLERLARRTAFADTAVTSLYSFMAALKQALPANVASIDAMLASEQLVAADAYGSTETNNAGGSRMYCRLHEHCARRHDGPAQHECLRRRQQALDPSVPQVHAPGAGQREVRSDCAAGRDPDIQVYRQGVQLAPVMGPANESFTLNNLTAADYVLDIYDCGNAGCNDMVAPAPTDLTISVTSN